MIALIFTVATLGLLIGLAASSAIQKRSLENPAQRSRRTLMLHAEPSFVSGRSARNVAADLHGSECVQLIRRGEQIDGVCPRGCRGQDKIAADTGVDLNGASHPVAGVSRELLPSNRNGDWAPGVSRVAPVRSVPQKRGRCVFRVPGP
jgi:hypothetical protein